MNYRMCTHVGHLIGMHVSEQPDNMASYIPEYSTLNILSHENVTSLTCYLMREVNFK
jgi:hypothetical protein